MKREEKQKLRLAEMLEFENKLYSEGIYNIVGVDEVGRGPLAGPVVAAAVILPRDFNVLGIDDSKKVSEKRREELYPIIKEKAIAYAIGMVDHRTIDEINILEATKRAMMGAIFSLQKKLEEKGLGDIEHVLIDAVKLDGLGIPQTGIIKGDAKSVSIAAASILAKVTRDHMMIKANEEYPGYSFDSNKGYGTKAHYEGLEKQGFCPIHRKTFIKKYL
ncbi:MAG: ribonuclease HII [Anaerovoracaceae bacterium]